MSTAAAIARTRALLPTALGTAGLRDAIAADIRARSAFAARLTNALVLSEIKSQVDLLAAGETDLASARLAVMEVIRATGYTPEGGFPGDPAVPPAIAGTLQDLGSRRRIDLILRTQRALMQGRGQQLRGTAPDRLATHPAWELYQALDPEVPRDWSSRWTIAGGQPGIGLIALKGHPVWGELGASGNFADALDVDYPPFAFNSGMRWREIPRARAIALGLTGPEGQSIDQWLSQDHPTLVATQSGIPAPQASVAGLHPEIRAAFESSAGITIVESTATTPGNEDAIRAAIARRRAERQARRAQSLADATAARAADYDSR